MRLINCLDHIYVFIYTHIHICVYEAYIKLFLLLTLFFPNFNILTLFLCSFIPQTLPYNPSCSFFKFTCLFSPSYALNLFGYILMCKFYILQCYSIIEWHYICLYRCLMLRLYREKDSWWLNLRLNVIL